MAKILFFTAEIGLAHLVRTLAVAEACRGQGLQVSIAIPKRKRQYVPKKLQVIEVQPLSHTDSMAVIQDHFDVSYFDRLVELDAQVIKQEKPELVVVDFRFSALIAGTICKVPVVLLSNSTALAAPHQWPSFGGFFVERMITSLFMKQVHSIVQLKLMRLFNRVLHDFDQPKQSSQWLQSLPTLIPEPREYLQPTKLQPNLYYIGPLQWRGFQTKTPQWIKRVSSTIPTIYVSFGGTGFSVDQLVEIAEQLVNQHYQVIVTTSTLVAPSAFPKHDRLFVSRYVDFHTIHKLIDVVVCHGGYGTLSQAAEYGIPMVIVPFNPDQMIHGLRFQELGLGICLFRLTPGRISELIRMEWEPFAAIGKHISSDKVARAVATVLSQKRYQKRAHQLQAQFDSTAAAKKGAQVIAGILKQKDN